MAENDGNGQDIQKGGYRLTFTKSALGSIRALTDEQRAELDSALLSLMQDPTESNPHVVRLPRSSQRK